MRSLHIHNVTQTQPTAFWSSFHKMMFSPHIDDVEGGSEPDWLDKRQRKLSDKICLCGVTLNSGTDDPVVLSLFAVALRATWLTCGIFLLAYYQAQPGCDDAAKQHPQTLTVALVGLVVIYCLGLITAFACGTISSLGTLTRPQPRRGVVIVLHLFLLLFISEFPWLLYSTYASASASNIPASNCTSYKNVVFMFCVETGVAWVIYFIIFVWYMINLDPCNCFTTTRLLKSLQTLQLHEMLDADMRSTSGHILYEVFRRLCCRCSGITRTMDARTAMRDVLKAISIVFGDFDATFSDLTAGLMLVKQYQRNLSACGRNPEAELCLATVNLLKHNGTLPTKYKTPPPIPLTREEQEEISAKCLRYIKYAEAAYGGVSSLGGSSLEAYKILCKATMGRVCCPKRFAIYHAEGESQFVNTAIISAAISLPQEYIVAFSFSNLIYHAEYFVTYNPLDYEMVVSVKGSSSTQDALTNISIGTLHVPGLGGIDRAYVHMGFYMTAVNIFEELKNNGRFMDVLNREKVDQFIFTGHSLGAAVTIFLSILFRDHFKDTPWVDKIEALGFCVPAATMNYVLAEEVQNFVTSVVAPHDMVSRLTLRSMSYFKLMVETMLVSVDSHKQQALHCTDNKWYQCCPPRAAQDEHLVGLAYLNYNKMPEGLEKAQPPYQCPLLESLPRWSNIRSQHAVYEFLENLSYKRSLAWENPEQPMLFVPGRILHIEVPGQYRTESSCDSMANGEVVGNWKARESLSTILIHPDMLDDHTLRRLVSLLRRWN